MGGTSTTVDEPRNTFKKEERLTNNKIMDELFKKGSSIVLEPVRLVWLKTELPVIIPAQVVITVSKRNFPRAIDRNRIKRMIRESYRQHKNDLYRFLTEKKISLALAIVYTGKNILPYEEMKEKIIVVLNRLIQPDEVD